MSTLSACGEGQESKGIKLGEPFPVVQVDRLDGTSLALESLRGRVIIFHIWASWCAPCRTELPSIKNLLKRLDPERFTFIALSVDDDMNLLQEFRRKYAVTFATYIDADRVIAEGLLGVTAYPYTFVIDQEGYLIQRMIGRHDWDSTEMIELLERLYREGIARESL